MSRRNIVNFDRREDGTTGATRTEQWSLAPTFGNCVGKEKTLGELVRHQSKIPVSLVNTLTIYVRPHIRLKGAGEIFVELGLKSPTSQIRQSGCSNVYESTVAFIKIVIVLGGRIRGMVYDSH